MFLQTRVAAEERPEIVIRNFEFSPDHTIPSLWCGGEAYFTALMNALSCLFPPGERFFIRSVLRVETLIVEPRLKRDIRLFCAQEAYHGAKYERLRGWIEECGYPVSPVLKQFESGFHSRVAFYGPWLSLSMTSALEHLTSLLSKALLESPDILSQFHPKVRPLVVWHAIEEIEHKAVAFEALQAVRPSYALRAFGMLLACMEFSIPTLIILTRFLAYRNELLHFGSCAKLISLGFRSGVVWNLLKGVGSYLLPSFHPWHCDDRSLLEKHATIISGR